MEGGRTVWREQRNIAQSIMAAALKRAARGEGHWWCCAPRVADFRRAGLSATFVLFWLLLGFPSRESTPGSNPILALTTLFWHQLYCRCLQHSIQPVIIT